MNFANLLSPVTVEDFFQNYWEKKVLHIKRNKTGFFDSILNVEILDAYLQRQDLLPLGFRLVREGVNIEAGKWTKEEKIILGEIIYTVNPEKLLAHFDQGATIIINSAMSGIPTLAKACRILEQELKISLQANIYITPPNSQGFAAHFDHHDILSLQIKGCKTWRIMESGENLPTRKSDFQKVPELIEELQMCEGDLMYIPRGTVHEAFASDSATIHLNFSFKSRYGFHLLKDLTDLAESEDVFFRRTIPHGFAGERERAEYVAEFSRKLVELIERHDAAKLLEKQFETFVEKQNLDLEQRFADLIDVEKLNLDSEVSRRWKMTLSIKQSADGVKIKFGENEIIIPKFIKPEIFLQNESFSVKDIQGLITEQSKIELVKEFIKNGFLKIEKI